MNTMCSCGNNTCGGCQPKIPTSPAGAPGKNAYTVLASSFTQPASSANVTITVSTAGQFTNAWAVPGQTIFIENGGYYSVVALVGINQITVQNLPYPNNAAPGTLIANGGKVSPSGERGEAGLAGANGTNGIARVVSNTTLFSAPGSGTGTLLLSETIPANTLNVNGKGLRVTVYWLNSGTSVLQTSLGVLFAGLDTCAGLVPGLLPLFTAGGTARGSIILDFIRTGATTASVYTTLSNLEVNGTPYSERFNMTGLDFTINNNFTIKYAQATSFDANVDGFFVDLIQI